MMVSPVDNSEILHASASTTRGTKLSQAIEPKLAKLRIAETFVSRQGEGALTGTDSFFIRTSGCNLRCWFCDTPYASWRPEGELRSIESLLCEVRAFSVRHVVLTGGEPLLPTESTMLCQTLRSGGYHVTIETAGTIDRLLSCDLLSLSPKLSSSAPNAKDHSRWHRLHQRRRLPIETMQKLIRQSDDHQVKFVVDCKDDFEEVLQITDSLAVDPDKVWVMPQGTTTEQLRSAREWLEPWASEKRFRFCDRMQIHWYGNRRGT